jgi:hypothetical protein
MLVAWLLFIASVSRTLGTVSREKRLFPIWFLWGTILLVLSYACSWFMTNPIIPLILAGVGLIFGWLMLPWGVPISLLRMVSADDLSAKPIRTLQYIGLVNQIALSLMWAIKVFMVTVTASSYSQKQSIFPLMNGFWTSTLALILALIGATAVISWVFYWSRAVAIRK